MQARINSRHCISCCGSPRLLCCLLCTKRGMQAKLISTSLRDLLWCAMCGLVSFQCGMQAGTGAFGCHGQIQKLQQQVQPQRRQARMPMMCLCTEVLRRCTAAYSWPSPSLPEAVACNSAAVCLLHFQYLGTSSFTGLYRSNFCFKLWLKCRSCRVKVLTSFLIDHSLRSCVLAVVQR